MDLSVFSQTPTALPEHRGLRCQASCPFQQMPDYSYSDCRLRQSTPAAGLRSSAASFSSAVRSSTCQAANPSLGSRSGSGPGLAQKLLTLCDNDLSVGQFAPCTLHHALCLPHEIFLTSKINSSLPTRCFTACRSQKRPHLAQSRDIGLNLVLRADGPGPSRDTQSEDESQAIRFSS